jgi:hypothetical protein
VDDTVERCPDVGILTRVDDGDDDPLGECSVALGASTVSGPGAVVPLTATLDDSVSSFNETLTVTPSIFFGNPGGNLSADSTTFARPSSCGAYLANFLPSGVYSPWHIRGSTSPRSIHCDV